MATIPIYPRGYPVIWACRGLNLVTDRHVPFPGYLFNYGSYRRAVWIRVSTFTTNLHVSHLRDQQFTVFDLTLSGIVNDGVWPYLEWNCGRPCLPVSSLKYALHASARYLSVWRTTLNMYSGNQTTLCLSAVKRLPSEKKLTEGGLLTGFLCSPYAPFCFVSMAFHTNLQAPAIPDSSFAFA